MEFNLQSLMATGLVAGIIGFWHQFKNILTQISALVIVQGRFDSNSSGYVIRYFRQHYKTFKSGITHYNSDSLYVHSHNRWRYAPFKRWNTSMLMWRGYHVVIVTFEGNHLTVYGLRSNTNLDTLVKDAYREWHAYQDSTKDSRTSSRFYIRDVIGTEKTFNSDGGHRGNTVTARGDDEAIESPQSSTLPQILDTIDHTLECSLLFNRDEYTLSQKKDPLRGLFYSPEVYDHIEDAKTWFRSGDWYAERSIPWRRGWLLYGPGGTGKSSLACVLAQMLGIPVYKYALATLSDQEFIREWQNMETPCLPLFEDFDAVFNGRESTTEHKSLTFDCVLNQISGVGVVDGVLLVITTNRLECIDPAIGISVEGTSLSSRPGRIDRVIYLGPTTADTRLSIAKHILRDWPDVHAELVETGEGYTPVQFQELCVQFALTKMKECPNG